MWVMVVGMVERQKEVVRIEFRVDALDVKRRKVVPHLDWPQSDGRAGDSYSLYTHLFGYLLFST
jgi:hypothetical protein